MHALHDNRTCLSTVFIENLEITIGLNLDRNGRMGVIVQAGTILTALKIQIVTGLAESAATSITVFLVNFVLSFRK